MILNYEYIRMTAYLIKTFRSLKMQKMNWKTITRVTRTRVSRAWADGTYIILFQIDKLSRISFSSCFGESFFKVGKLHDGAFACLSIVLTHEIFAPNDDTNTNVIANL